MPILGVDGELLQYGASVADLLRQFALSTKLTGIQVGLQQVNTGTSGVTYDNGYYGNGYYGNGYGYYDASAARREIRAQGRAVTASDLQKVRTTIIAATADMRRKMTLKYQVEF